MQPQQTIRARFFRLHLMVGLITVLLITISLGTTDYYRMRNLLVDGFERLAVNVGALYATMEQTEDRHILDHYLDSFRARPGLKLLCLYDKDGVLGGNWKEEQYDGKCPQLLTAVETKTQGFMLHLARAIQTKKGYVGMVYLESELETLRDWLINAVLMLGIIGSVAIGTCLWSANYSARNVMQYMEALRRQIECLKQTDILFCQSTTLNNTRETAELAASLVSLRTYFLGRTVPIETVTDMRNWHWELLSGLLAMLRGRLNVDSPLLAPLSDYHLLMQMERGDLLPTPVVFHMSKILDSALATARRSQPPGLRMNLTASLQIDMPKLWIGHPHALEALFQHLLLIGLKRTRQGYVSLRLEIEPASLHHTHRLRIFYEDSGQQIQQWQLEHWLNPLSNDNAPLESNDLSWLLVERLAKRLSGSLHGHVGHEKGIGIEGTIPLTIALETQLPTPTWEAARNNFHTTPPLVLIVEEQAEHRHILAEMFREAQCTVMLVETHNQAVELAPILPFSVILVNATQADAGEDVTRRLRYLAEDGVMPRTPLWVILDTLSVNEVEYWHARGVTELLLRPLSLTTITRICAALRPMDMHFFGNYNEHVRGDLSSEILALLPKMNQMLAEQLAMLVPIVENFAQGERPPSIVEEAHAVKSAALTLGYFRLAGLMDYIEHAGSSLLYQPENWTVIARILGGVRFEGTHMRGDD